MGYDWNFSFLANPAFRALLLDGAFWTTLLSLAAILIGTVLGVALGGLSTIGVDTFEPLRASLSTPSTKGGVAGALRLVRLVTLMVIDVVRAIPLLLLILAFYFSFPLFFSGSERNSVFVPCLVALTINLAAFVADLIRSATVALPKGMVVSARALGFTAKQCWLNIVLPQIYRDILPSMVILYITIFKMSTLASAVSFYELLHSANAIIQTNYRPVEVYMVVAFFFVLIIVPFEILARSLETTSAFRRRSL